VNEFVEECRREWRRLEVSESLASEMAADLQADLEEAEAEGVSAEEVLGSGAFDSRSFAAAWAAERGVVGRPSRRRGRLWSSRVPAAVTVLALVVAVLGAALVLLASPSAEGPVDVWSSGPALSVSLPRPRVLAGSDFRVIRLTASSPVALTDVSDSGFPTRTVGSVLLIAGLAGVVPLTLFWLWAGPARRSRRTPIDDVPSGVVS
jgi:hypothetical protein